MRNSIPDHELPGWLVIIIVGLVAILLLLSLAYIGYLPSPLSAKLDAAYHRAGNVERAVLISCGAMLELTKRSPLKCFENSDPRSIFVGTR